MLLRRGTSGAVARRPMVGTAISKVPGLYGLTGAVARRGCGGFGDSSTEILAALAAVLAAVRASRSPEAAAPLLQRTGTHFLSLAKAESFCKPLWSKCLCAVPGGLVHVELRDAHEW